MPAKQVVNASSIAIENFGNLTLHKIHFGNISGVGSLEGPRTTYNSSLNAIVGYWFQATKAGTQTREGVSVSLISNTRGSFRLTAGETRKEGDLYVFTLS